MDVLNFGEIVNLLLVLSIAASVAGFMAGLLGVGGGIIMVPALYYAFTVLDFDIATRMHISVGTSLAIIVPTSIISAKTHMEHKAVDVNLVKSFGIFIVLGVIGGTFLAINLRTSDFILFFSIMAFIVGLFFIFFRDKFLENPKKIKDSIKNISGVVNGNTLFAIDTEYATHLLVSDVDGVLGMIALDHKNINYVDLITVDKTRIYKEIKFKNTPVEILERTIDSTNAIERAIDADRKSVV